MPVYVEAEDVIADAGVQTPASDPDTEWATQCAAAVQEAIDHELAGVTITDPSGPFDAIRAAARVDAAAAYVSRRAPHGILSVGPEGQAVRLGSDIIRALRPVLARYSERGGFGGIG